MDIYYYFLLFVSLTCLTSILGERKRLFLKKQKREEEKKILAELDSVKHLQL